MINEDGVTSQNKRTQYSEMRNRYHCHFDLYLSDMGSSIFEYEYDYIVNTGCEYNSLPIEKCQSNSIMSLANFVKIQNNSLYLTEFN